jgi:hypothetical protein
VLEIESELLYVWRVTARQFVLETNPLRLTTSDFFFQLNTSGYSLYVTWVCRCNCCWSSPAQSFTGPSPVGLKTTLYCLRFETDPTRSPYLYLPGTGWPGYSPRHWFHFRLLLRLSGLQWRYSTPSPTGYECNNLCVSLSLMSVLE